MNPLLLVFTTLEAAELWNRDSGDVRSAASGAGIGRQEWGTATEGNRDGPGSLQETPWNAFTGPRYLKK